MAANIGESLGMHAGKQRVKTKFGCYYKCSDSEFFCWSVTNELEIIY